MGTLTDADLRHLLGEAGTSYAVQDSGRDAVLQAVVPGRRTRWLVVPAAAAVVAVALLAGTQLTGGQQPDAQSVPVAAAPVPVSGDVATGGSGDDVAREQLAGGAGATTGGTTGSTTFALDAAAPAAAAPVPPTSGGKTVPQAAAPVADGARVVKTGAIALIVEDDKVTPTLTQVQGFATAVGGVVATAKTQESGETPSGSVVLRVPVDTFEEVVAKVRSMGAEVRSATTSGQDVTAQYADIEAQQRTLTAARERFLEILSRARTIGDVLAVQQRVDDVTGKLDRLEGQRRVLAAQSDKATLEVSVAERDDPVVTQEEADSGLGKAFRDAWDGFTSGVEGLVRLSGRGVLLLLCLAVGYGVVRLGWRASRRRLV